MRSLASMLASLRGFVRRWPPALAALLVALPLAACVAEKDGSLRISRYADQAEVDALVVRADGTDGAVKTLRADHDAAISKVRTDEDAAVVAVRKDAEAGILNTSQATTKAMDALVVAAQESSRSAKDSADRMGAILDASKATADSTISTTRGNETGQPATWLPLVLAALGIGLGGGAVHASRGTTKAVVAAASAPKVAVVAAPATP